MREVIEIRAEMCFEHVGTNVDHIAVEQMHKIFSANIENIVARLVMLMHLHAASTEELRDII